MLKIFILLVIATNFIFAGNLKVGDKLDGHIVQGHVDTTAFIEDVININNNKQIIFSLHESKMQYLKYIFERIV